MSWMVRFFEEVIAGNPRQLVDLETGAGKTELVVIWLLALAWFGFNGCKGLPVPRRLVWVVNRRVLVQQVFKIAKELRIKMACDAEPELNDLRTGLQALCGNSGEVFQVVELRGQIVADRDWAIRPAIPQLIIGTVDQIGSRLLFQGYGLGKWGRPQQAGLLGVDSWVAVDEAHLVSAFVLTLRQLRERCASSTEGLPPPFNAVFVRLPFWLTELSATPGLPPPSSEQPFRLTDEERADPAIADRVLAARTRRVKVESLQKAEKPKDVLIQKLVIAATESKAARIAIFVREVGVADKVADGIKSELKKAGIPETRVCKITGRIRGYERDRLSQREAFRAFLSERTQPNAESDGVRYFLVGTAAAEVGLDADADTILCDFAPLPTLLQRLGRLDRRGVLSRRHADGNGDAPTMQIFARPDETKPKTKETIQSQLTRIAKALKDDTTPYSAKLMAGTHWLAKGKATDAEGADPSNSVEEKKEEKSAKNQTDLFIEAATWDVLNQNDGTCGSPMEWLAHDVARIAAGPVVVPPVTNAVLDYWSATTDPRSPYLSPHPFLYGLADNDEGTPLVGVAFRLEVEALREPAGDEEDPETTNIAAEVLEIFERFPPLRAELHQMKLSAVREWLTSPEGEEHPLVYRSRDKWHAKGAGESASEPARALGPNSTLVLPASALMRSKAFDSFMKDCQQSEEPNIAISDVLEGWSDPQHARYLRTIEPKTGRTGGEGAWLWDSDAEEKNAPVAKTDGYKRSLLKKLRIGGTEYTFRYFRPFRPEYGEKGLQFLDDHNGTLGHLNRAEMETTRIAEAIVPGDTFLRVLLSTAALQHDEGKRHSHWQRAFGRRKEPHDIAKLVPGLERPAPLKGFRHEWESLRKLVGADTMPPSDISVDSHTLWRDLLLHLIGVHHGHLRPSISDAGLTPGIEVEKQNSLRLESAERFTRLQRQLGHWRLAYLEALLKTADAEGSRNITEEEPDGI